MPIRHWLFVGLLAACPLQAMAKSDVPSCTSGLVFADRNGNGLRDSGEPGLGDIAVSNGRQIARTDGNGLYHLTPRPGAAVFVIKPPGYAMGRREDGLPDTWRSPSPLPPATTPYPDFIAGEAACGPFALRPDKRRREGLNVLLFGDPQPKSEADVGYYARGIVDAVIDDAAARMHSFRITWAGQTADLGLTLGDVVDDEPSLYPAVKRETARLMAPWLHAPGNHDINAKAAQDEDSLDDFHAAFGPDTYAWEEPEASFVVLDDVVWQPASSPKYIGGLREEQFTFLENYLRTARKDRLLVLAMHIPLFEPAGKDTFRDADRALLFALLKDFPQVLLLSAHSHAQQHVFHDARTGWHGARPLHEYNVGATCGAFWSGVKDAAGVPDSTMADGTPKGWARLRVQQDGRYTLSYHPARAPAQAMHLHAPKVLRRGAYPAWGVYANVYMGDDDTRVDYRVDGGAWQPMRKVSQPDPAVLLENSRDDEAEALRGFDRSPEATPSAHLWRGALPTELAIGAHQIEVRARLRDGSAHSATTSYRLEDAAP